MTKGSEYASEMFANIKPTPEEIDRITLLTDLNLELLGKRHQVAAVEMAICQVFLERGEKK